jgi:hypothetical protein
VDRLLDAAESTVTVGVRELCCRLGVAGGSFARGAENLRHAARLTVAEETLRQVVESEGKAVLAASRDEQLELDWSAKECTAAEPSGRGVSRVYVSADGVMVPVTTAAEKRKRRATALRKRRRGPRPPRGRRPRLAAPKRGSDQRWKQIYLTRVYDQDNRRRLVSATRGNHKALGRLLRREAERVRLRAADQRVGLVDGAVCLKTHMQGLPLTAVGLDFYHLSEHVNQARRDTFGEDAPAGEQWAQQVLHAARHEGYPPFWDHLTRWRGRQRGGKRRDADALLHYVAQRADMMAYDEFERHGWHVGTGPIESMCKATTRRIKGPGMRWDVDHAEAMMALECLYQSNLWDQYWTKVAGARN